MLRAFIAVDVSAISAISKVQAEIATESGWGHGEVKPVEPSNFHFTLIFLGEIAESDVGKIQQRLSTLSFQAIDISYTGVGAFPKAHAARVIWAGLDKDGSQKLSELACVVVSAMSDLGFRPDKPFSPHLTLFRVKARHPVDVSSFVRKYDGALLGSDHLDKIHLKKSELRPSGPIYSNVYTVEAKRNEHKVA